MACPTSDRRRFLKTTAALGAGYWVAGGLAAQESNSPNERLRMACIGVAGKGGGRLERRRDVRRCRGDL
ncbi:MAG: hypothetical protein ACYC4U_14305 [Pirellulaceae bacterium]